MQRVKRTALLLPRVVKKTYTPVDVGLCLSWITFSYLLQRSWTRYCKGELPCVMKIVKDYCNPLYLHAGSYNLSSKQSFHFEHFFERPTKYSRTILEQSCGMLAHVIILSDLDTHMYTYIMYSTCGLLNFLTHH